jgi:5-methylcytosine-specific restriction protein A
MTYSKPEYHRLYNTAHWKRLRALQLREHPLCEYCTQLGLTVLATVADHVKPHGGDTALFYDAQNLQSLCKACHDKAKQIEEAHGVKIGSDVSGLPMDKSHHWHD